MAIDQSIDNKIPPIKIEKMRHKYPQLYDRFFNK
jgi:hypothetical protein